MSKSPKCPACGANLDLVGRTHRCVPKSDGGVEGHAATMPVTPAERPVSDNGAEASVPLCRPQAGIKPGPSDTPKRGRPRLGEKRQRHEPWKALGLTERTYYRRLKAERERSTKK